MKRVLKKLHEVEEKICQFEKMSFQNFQSFKWFKSLRTGETIRFDNGVVSTKVSEMSDRVVFNVVIPPNTVFPEHWHDCKEIIQVLKGALYDKDLTYEAKKGDVIEIPSTVIHQPYTKDTETTILMIEFNL